MKNLVNPKRILPPHSIDKDCTYDELVKSMKKHGWKGRPIVVSKMKKNKRWDYYAFTGSHRIRAARKVGIKVPIVILPHRIISEFKNSYDGWFVSLYEDADSYIRGAKSCINWDNIPRSILKILAKDGEF